MKTKITVEFESIENTLVANLFYESGNLPPDLEYVATFNEILDRLENPDNDVKYTKLLINMEGLKYIQSTGIAGLLQLHSRSKEMDVELELTHVDKDIVSILTAMNLNEYFHITTKR